MKKYFVATLLITMAGASFIPTTTYAAATMGLSPSTGSVTVGETKTTSVALSSGNQSVNAAQATISFPTDKLEVVGVSKGNIFTLWTKEPTYSNSSGTVSFAGGVPNPGFQGHGTMISITFRAKKAGTANLSIGGAQALANDGKGTNIYGGAGGASYTINEEKSAAPAAPSPQKPTEKQPEKEEKKDEEPEEEKASPPAAPAIASDTHPEQNTWYANGAPRFAWTKEEGVTGFSYALDDQPSTIPKEQSSTTENTTIFSNIPDGTWYFHVKAVREDVWSETGHYTIHIDTTPPKDLLTRLEGEVIRQNRNPIIHFSASDELSGLDSYQIFVDDALVSTLGPEATEITLQTLPYGKHKITIKALDKAKNEASQSIDVEIVKYYPGVGFTVGDLFIPYALVNNVLLGIILLLILILILLAIWYARHNCVNYCDHPTSKTLTPVPLPLPLPLPRQKRKQIRRKPRPKKTLDLTK